MYVSEDAADTFLHSFLTFSGSAVVSDERTAPGDEIGKPGTTLRRSQVSSTFGRLVVFVADGHLPYPYGLETTGYEVDDLAATLKKATSLGAEVLVPSFKTHGRNSAIVQFPGGYTALRLMRLHHSGQIERNKNNSGWNAAALPFADFGRSRN